MAPVEHPASQTAQAAAENSLSAADTDPAAGGMEKKSAQEGAHAANCLQVAAATGIGLFCLAVLLLLRNTPLGDAAMEAQPDRLTATVAQFRDFVSGCVGFLIGCPTHSTTTPQS